MLARLNVESRAAESATVAKLVAFAAEQSIGKSSIALAARQQRLERSFREFHGLGATASASSPLRRAAIGARVTARPVAEAVVNEQRTFAAAEPVVATGPVAVPFGT